MAIVGKNRLRLLGDDPDPSVGILLVAELNARQLLVEGGRVFTGFVARAILHFAISVGDGTHRGNDSGRAAAARFRKREDLLDFDGSPLRREADVAGQGKQGHIGDRGEN